MPCKDWDGIDNKESALVQRIAELSKNPPASLLCEACAILEDNGLSTSMSDDLYNWYKQHESQEVDKVRLEAAEKLTARERRLLGIDLDVLKRKAKK